MQTEKSPQSGADGAQEPPTTLGGIVLKLGPGLILVGNIVGSGELIATPRLSAEAGYYFLWLILFSCVIKVFFQIEIGRYAVSEGRTTLESLNELPGPRQGVNWLLWYWLAMMCASLVQSGGMCGGVAQALRIAAPIWNAPTADTPEAIAASQHTNDAYWAIVTGASVIVLLWWGRYKLIERVAMALVTIFTVITVYSVLQLQTTPFAVTMEDLKNGFSFQFPEGADEGRVLVVALMAFGITGVGASELIMYPYWCLEKGYGRFVGPRTGDEAWLRRARGWVRVMHYDAWSCMVLFTIATVAFYLLGAALLHADFRATGSVPKGAAMVERLSRMYSETFGEYAKYVFLIGAFSVLYSTFFIAAAANARMLTDWLGVIGAYDRRDDEKRRLLIAFFCVLFPIISTSAYLFVREPVIMVMVSGVMQAMMLPMMGYGVLYFAHKRTDRRLRAGRLWFATLWVSFVLMTLVALYGAYRSVAEYLQEQKNGQTVRTQPLAPRRSADGKQTGATGIGLARRRIPVGAGASREVPQPLGGCPADGVVAVGMLPFRRG